MKVDISATQIGEYLAECHSHELTDILLMAARCDFEDPRRRGLKIRQSLAAKKNPEECVNTLGGYLKAMADGVLYGEKGEVEGEHQTTSTPDNPLKQQSKEVTCK